MAEANVLSTGQTPLACELCGSTDIDNEVTWYCNDCKASLCCKCEKEHIEGKPVLIFKRHKTVPRTEALKSKLSLDEPCSSHRGSNYILHCNTCHQLVCHHCITEEHNGHDFCKIEDAMETVRQDIIQYSNNMENTILAECVDMESTITENEKRCEDFYDIKESDVQEKREKLTSEVNRLCDDVLQTIATEKKKNMSIIDQDKIAIQAKIQEIKMLLNTKKEVMKNSNSEMIKFMKEKPAIADFKLPTVCPLQLPSLIDEQLEGLQVIQSSPKTDNSMIPHPGDNDVSASDNQLKQSMTTDDKNQEPQSAEASVIDVQILSRHKYDTPIYNITSVDDDSVWFSGHGSKKLILVTTKGQTQIPTELPVSHFTVLPSGDLITSHFGDKCLQVMTETGEVTTTINTDPDSPIGVCLTNDRRHVVVCLYSPDMTSKLAVFGLDGQRKETFQYTDRKPSDFYPQRVTTNQSGDYCVAYNGLYSIFVVSNTGTLKFTYDGSNASPKTGSFNPFDITCDKCNNLLISDYGSNTIHMVDQQGKFLRYLLTSEHGVTNPIGLSLDRDGKLLVGLEDGTLLVVKYLK